jgi:uncharacterized protein (TIGR02145 family)
MDNCGICDNDTTNDCVNDCAGDWAGTATVDNCEQCVGGNTGVEACVQDCTGEWGGDSPDSDNDGICDWNDGDSYETVIIGEQEWMAENLKVTHYRNGDEIPNITNNGDWPDLSTGAYGDYNNNPSNSETYGRLYNWYAVADSRGICPEGYHVPTDGEYTALTDYLGGTSVAGGKMKECTEGSCPESEYWESPNTGATNESGFTSLPGGYRYNAYGDYDAVGNHGSLWSSTESSNGSAWGRRLNYNDSGVSRYSGGKDYGISVRCIRD